MKIRALSVAFLPFLVLSSFAQSPVQSPPSANSDEAALIKSEADFERARAEKGGTLEIESGAGAGTTLVMRIPLPPDRDEGYSYEQTSHPLSR